jgi:hypothetical protein
MKHHAILFTKIGGMVLIANKQNTKFLNSMLLLRFQFLARNEKIEDNSPASDIFFPKIEIRGEITKEKNLES